MKTAIRIRKAKKFKAQAANREHFKIITVSGLTFFLLNYIINSLNFN